MATSKKTDLKPPETKKAPSLTTPDRVVALKKFFKDYASGKGKGATFNDDVESAAELHLLVAMEAAGKKQTDEKWKSAIKQSGNVDVVNKYNEAPLHWAVAAQAESLILMLLEHGANVNAMSEFGSPLHYQTAIGFAPKFFEILLNAGADAELRNKQKKLPINYLGTKFKRYFQERVGESRIRLLAREFQAGRSPSLSLDAMRNAIDGALSLYAADFEYEGNPSYYLQTNGVDMRSGTPHCSACNMSFGDEKKYARHMMSIDHILKHIRTTEAAMLEARAYLEAKGMFSSVYGRRLSKEEVLRDYPEELR